MPKKGNDGDRGGRRSRSDGPSGGFDASSEPLEGRPNVPDVAPNFQSASNRIKDSGQKIKDSRAFKDGVGGIGRLWTNYINALKLAFARLDRRGQEELITRMSQIISVGSAVITTYIWYWFMPQGVRVIVLPIVLIGSWWVGTRVVGPSMITRFEGHLHPDDY